MDPRGALGEVVGFDRTRERRVRNADPEVIEVPWRMREGEMDVKSKAPPNSIIDERPSLFSKADNVSFTDTVLCRDFANSIVAVSIGCPVCPIAV